MDDAFELIMYTITNDTMIMKMPTASVVHCFAALGMRNMRTRGRVQMDSVHVENSAEFQSLLSKAGEIAVVAKTVERTHVPFMFLPNIQVYS